MTINAKGYMLVSNQDSAAPISDDWEKVTDWDLVSVSENIGYNSDSSGSNEWIIDSAGDDYYNINVGITFDGTPNEGFSFFLGKWILGIWFPSGLELRCETNDAGEAPSVSGNIILNLEGNDRLAVLQKADDSASTGSIKSAQWTISSLDDV